MARIMYLSETRVWDRGLSSNFQMGYNPQPSGEETLKSAEAQVAAI